MPKWFDDDDEDGVARGYRGHRNRSRQRKRWDDAEPTPSYAPSSPRRPEPSAAPTPPAAVTAPVTAETGTVRFFEPTKGFGFIAPENPGPDVFVHITAVRRAGLETLTQGQVIKFERGPGRQPGKEAVTRIFPT